MIRSFALPSTTLTEAGVRGISGIVNVPVGAVSVEASVSGETPHFSGEATIRAGAITGVFTGFHSPPATR